MKDKEIHIFLITRNVRTSIVTNSLGMSRCDVWQRIGDIRMISYGHDDTANIEKLGHM